jgi:hypothetical protein
MNHLPLVLFISFFLTTSAQWHIKKNDQLKNGGYRNPGKRSVLDRKSDILPIDCSQPFSQLNSHQEQVAWILTCLHDRFLMRINDNSLSSESEDIQFDTISTTRSIPTLSDDAEYQSSFNKLLSRLRKGATKTRK